MFKIALLIGINYSGDAELFGCVNDVDLLVKLLKEQYKYDYIFTLKDTEASASNIISYFQWFAQLSHHYPTCEIWVSYSGHGSYIIDHSGDEVDGKDEVIVPYDYKTSGIISDDVLNTFLQQINQKSKCIMLFDCCHSGTILDLKYQYDKFNDRWIENINSTDLASNIIMISGCMDSQTSADAYNLENSRQYQGALTTSFIKTLKDSGYTITADQLMTNIRNYLKEKGFSQIPQITCSKQFGKNCMFSKNIYGNTNHSKFYIP